MPLAVVASRALAGIDATEVTVEVHLGPGLPAFNVVGLPDAEVREAKDRVRAALNQGGFEFPARRITVNLAPADLPKDSSRYDLPMALGILASSGQLPAGSLAGHEFAGELSLTGDLRPVRGALAMALGAERANRRFVLPAENAAQAALVAGAQILSAATLLQVCAHLSGSAPIEPYRLAATTAEEAGPMPPDFSEVRGQAQAKRAMEVAAAGCHHLLLVGPPGTGKSMLAARFPGILPPMSGEEAIETAAIYSASSAGFDTGQWARRPYRAPHHTATSTALVGGGSPPRPGEISLAHNGVLFLDELPEFPRAALEALREPLECGAICISRAARQAVFPARFQLVAAMNPCPCGYLGDATGRCRCLPDQVARYRGKISGPLLDRIDFKVEAPAPRDAELSAAVAAEGSAAIRARVVAARERQTIRQGKSNAMLGVSETERYCALDSRSAQLLRQAITRLPLSARAYHRVLRVARTVADLAGAGNIANEHVAEAIQYRRR